MSDQIFVRRTRIEAPAEEAFRWHQRPGALERLTPPWSPVVVVERTGGIEAGARVVLKIPVGPTHVRWVAEHVDYVEGREFRDVQVEGPFARWEHTHRFEPDAATACFLEDRITFALPFGAFGELFGARIVRRLLEQTFAYRHRVTAADIRMHARYPGAPLHLLVSGARGLIGSALVPFLTTGGHRVTRMIRNHQQAGAATIGWDPASGRLDAAGLEQLDAVVHLAGENIASGRWTEAQKARIRNSRTTATRKLCETLGRLASPPKVLVSASAIGYYGNRGSQTLDETSAPGSGFLAEVCREWEAATEPAVAAGIRVVCLRFGVVLSAAGGALAKLLLPFKMGVGGRIGDGSQYMSWVAVDDVLGAILHALRTETLSGAVNVVAPEPVANLAFTETLGHVLSRPTLFPLPAFAARLAFGEMADDMLLASAQVQPTVLTKSGYVFREPRLEDALRHTLGR